MAGFMERVKEALGARRDESAQLALTSVPGTPVAVGKHASALEPKVAAGFERLRVKVECTPNGVFALLAIASLDARVSEVPRLVPFNHPERSDGVFGVERSRRSWRIVGTRDDFLFDGGSALPRDICDLSRDVIREARRRPENHSLVEIKRGFVTDASVEVALASVWHLVPRHVLVAALACPTQAIAALGTEGDAVELIDAILSRGVRIDEPLSDGMPSALACAAARGDEKAVAALLSAGADPRAYTFGRGPAFDAMMLAGSAGTVKQLKQAGYDFSATDDENQNALFFTLYSDWSTNDRLLRSTSSNNFRCDPRWFRALVEAGANPRQRNILGEGPLDRDRTHRYLGEAVNGDTFEMYGEIRIRADESTKRLHLLESALRGLGHGCEGGVVATLEALGWTPTDSTEYLSFAPAQTALTAGQWDVDRERLLRVLAKSGFDGMISVLSSDQDVAIAYTLESRSLLAETHDSNQRDDPIFGRAP